MDLGSFVIGFLAGIASGYALKFVVDVRGSSARAKNNSVAQSGNKAGGHIAGGDVNTHEK